MNNSIAFVGTTEKLPLEYEVGEEIVFKIRLEENRLCGREPREMPSGNGVNYFDTAIAASYVKCPTYIISGLGDLCCPPSTQLAIYNNIKTRKYHEFYQNKGHSYVIPAGKAMCFIGDETMKDWYSEIKGLYYL